MPRSITKPFTWLGGKHFLVGKLLPLVPHHKAYIEPFGGGASMLLRKDPAPIEVYNDIDAGLANFFRVIKDEEKFKRFYRMAVLTLVSREEYMVCRDTWQDEKDDVIRAYKWFVVARLSFGGLFAEAWGFSVNSTSNNMAQRCASWMSALAGMVDVHERFKNVIVENADWRVIMDKYDSPDAFFYLDPPYVPSTRRAGKYAHELTMQDHEDLIERILKAEGKILLSGYDNELYDGLVDAGWTKMVFETTCFVIAHTTLTKNLGKGALKDQKRHETIWMNYNVGGGLC